MSGSPETEPGILDLLEAFFVNILAKYHGPMWGKVTAYTAANQTCDIRPMVKIPIVGQYVAAPVLQSVPVRWPGGGGGALTFPLAAGDICEIKPMAADHSAVIASGSDQQNPPTGRRYSLSDCCAVPLFRPLSNPLPSTAYHASSPVFSGNPVLLGDSSADQWVALANLVKDELDQIKTDFDAHIHTTPAGNSGVPTVPMTTPSAPAATKVKAK